MKKNLISLFAIVLFAIGILQGRTNCSEEKLLIPNSTLNFSISDPGTITGNNDVVTADGCGSAGALVSSCDESVVLFYDLDQCQVGDDASLPGTVTNANGVTINSPSNFRVTEHDCNGQFGTTVHSCVSSSGDIGAEGSPDGICYSASDLNYFNPVAGPCSDDPQHFYFTFNANSSSNSKLSSLSFYFKGNNIINRQSPRKVGVRILKNGVTVFEQSGLTINDAQVWQQYTIDLSDDPDFTLSSSNAQYEVRIQGYAPDGNGTFGAVAEIDQIRITGCDNTITNPCDNQGGDTDNDGVCNNQDCQPNNPAFPATPGSPCNDGNSNTTNDVVTADGCGCAGTPVGPACSVSVGPCSISIDGLSNADYTKIFNANWQIVWDCNPWANGGCNSSETITDLENGTYHVQACGQTQTVTVTGCTSVDPCNDQGGDTDNDGVCNNQDCQPNNPAFPATPGSPCNDGNSNTTNDVVTADGCGCAGTPVSSCDESVVLFYDLDECQVGDDASLPGTVTNISGININSPSNFRVTEHDCNGQFGTTVHSCVSSSGDIGAEGSPDGICYSASDLNYFNPVAGPCSDDPQHFYFTFNANSNNNSSLSSLSFYFKGNNIINRQSPRKVGVRILKNGVTVFEQSGLTINDAQVWQQYTIDLSDDPDFTLSSSNAQYEVRIQGYAPDGNGTLGAVAEIDQIRVTACDNTTNPTDPCSVGSVVSNAPFTVSFNDLDAAPIAIAKLFDKYWNLVFSCAGDCDPSYVLTGMDPGECFYQVDYFDANWQRICVLSGYVDVQGGTSSIVSQSSEFLHFDVVRAGQTTRLNWASNTEFKNDYFVIERSANGVDFENLFEVESLSAEGEVYTSYQDQDTAPMVGMNYYRLKQVYQDGSHRYSVVKQIEFDVDVSDVSIFPNPATDLVYVALKEFAGQSATIQLVNNLGEIVDMVDFKELPEEPIGFDISNLPSSIYGITIKVDGHKRLTKLFVKNRL